MKKYILICIVLTLAIVLVLTACKDDAGVGADPLDGTAWVLFAYRKSRPIAETTITAMFENGQVHGSAGCNSFGGDYSIHNDKISFENVAITLR